MISPSLIYDPTHSQVARAVVSAGCYLIRTDGSPENFYTWKSGIRAPVYTDCRVLNGDPFARAIVMRALGSAIRENFPTAECIVGVAEAGVVWSTLAATELSLPHAFVRKTPKPYGSGSNVEGSPPKGARAVLVDDLVASGDSLAKSITVLAEEKGIATIGILSIVNWDFLGMRDTFRNLGIPVRALVSYPQLLQAALEAGQIDQAAKSELEMFYRNPRKHQWNLEAFRSKTSVAA